jgi:hypothetical protein
MILRDMPPRKIARLKAETFVFWKGYRIDHIPKKWFTVTGEYRGKKVSVRIQDVFSFFGCSFVKALKGWGVGTVEEIAEIESGKDSRSHFKLSEVDTHIRPYWEKELRLLVDLGNTLRSNLYSAGLEITSWFGPGNIATFLYKKHGIADIMNQELPNGIITASQYAYAGGRFEGFKAGFHDGPVYSADINSAYPYALSTLPNLRSGAWHHFSGSEAEIMATMPTRVGLYRIEFTFRPEIARMARKMGLPLPVFHRRRTGHVWYPEMSHGWYHAPEMRLLMRAFDENDGKSFTRFRIHEAWIYEDDGTSPFQWVSEMYEQRAQWKRDGNAAQLALKLGINSLYGKLAQRIGSKDGKPPTWHQLEWAGAITAQCRAMIFEAALKDWRNVIGVETDGIYSTAPIVLPGNGQYGSGLGEWEGDDYSGILFLQNGVYWLRDPNGDWKPPKSRGIPQSHLSIDAAFAALRNGEDLVASQQYFIGYGTALHRSPERMERWRTWTTGSKRFEFGGNGKRFHNPRTCPECTSGMRLDEGLHTLSLRLPELRSDSVMSTPHFLPWKESETALTKELDHAEMWDITDA